MDKENQQEQKELKGVLYEQDKINQVLNLLNTIPVSGFNQVKAMSTIFDILAKPIPFTQNKGDEKQNK